MQENEGTSQKGGSPILLPLLAAFGGGLAAMLLVNGGSLLADLAGYHQGTPTEAETPDPKTAGFQPPSPATIPDGPDGDAIRRGMAIFSDTPGNARAYVGGALSCTNCHLDGGRRPKASPMWAAWGLVRMGGRFSRKA